MVATTSRRIGDLPAAQLELVEKHEGLYQALMIGTAAIGGLTFVLYMVQMRKHLNRQAVPVAEIA